MIQLSPNVLQKILSYYIILRIMSRSILIFCLAQGHGVKELYVGILILTCVAFRRADLYLALVYETMFDNRHSISIFYDYLNNTHIAVSTI